MLYTYKELFIYVSRHCRFKKFRYVVDMILFQE